ncbi:MAG: DUF423 domain-containing protein [Deltaproteobacteria bacterium]|nr:DUF423 domain-containing protein [Deltaproteobacteria bacterium]
MVKFWLILSAISGFLTVALGAFGAHSLKNLLDDYGKSIYEKAILYQMFHTMALFGVGLLQHFIKQHSLAAAGWGFLMGILLFSGSLYLLAITGTKWLGATTPIGGISFLFGWAYLIWVLAKTHLT